MGDESLSEKMKTQALSNSVVYGANLRHYLYAIIHILCDVKVKFPTSGKKEKKMPPN